MFISPVRSTVLEKYFKNIFDVHLSTIVLKGKNYIKSLTSGSLWASVSSYLRRWLFLRFSKSMIFYWRRKWRRVISHNQPLPVTVSHARKEWKQEQVSFTTKSKDPIIPEPLINSWFYVHIKIGAKKNFENPDTQINLLISYPTNIYWMSTLPKML